MAGVVAALGTVSVAAAAFALSFDAIRDTAVAAHVRPSLAWLLPVSVDGAMAVAVVCAVLLRQMRRPAWYPWTVVLAGAGISMVCNALHAYVAGGTIALPREWAMAISSVPAVLLAMSVHLVVVLAEAVTHVARPAGSSTARRAAAGDARSARRPSPQQAPADRPPASAPVTGGRTATRAVQQRRGPAGHPGGKPSVAQMADAVTAQFGPVKVIKKDAMAAVKQAFGSCSDDRARAARDEHNRRHGYLGEVEP